MRDLIKQVEWSYTRADGQKECCPWCHMHKQHHSGCPVKQRSFRVLLDFAAESLRFKIGDTVTFDGRYVLVSGCRYACPEFRVALSAGWVEPIELVPGKSESLSLVQTRYERVDPV